ncbi:MAG: cytochrome C oxidase subunit IV family protein [Acidobacteria bacterium]|nr:cytochrome C oxidase subunit IV family protein [Acidobacteriota bacterium]
MVAKAGLLLRPRLYWATWLTLLALTVVMLVADGLSVPRLAFLVVVLSAMLVKASLIGAHFMHLRFERLPLALTVIVGLLLTGVILFALIAPDAVRIAAMSHR